MPVLELMCIGTEVFPRIVYGKLKMMLYIALLISYLSS